mmetsp:Transcript_28507/g.75246  ORF Transcript_28507/g.75246 Transcript_28507/m.75246 type:complete len:220 (+) Transcript_28507:62-721(+)
MYETLSVGLARHQKRTIKGVPSPGATTPRPSPRRTHAVRCAPSRGTRQSTPVRMGSGVWGRGGYDKRAPASGTRSTGRAGSRSETASPQEPPPSRPLDESRRRRPCRNQARPRQSAQPGTVPSTLASSPRSARWSCWTRSLRRCPWAPHAHSGRNQCHALCRVRTEDRLAREAGGPTCRALIQVYLPETQPSPSQYGPARHECNNAAPLPKAYQSGEFW